MNPLKLIEPVNVFRRLIQSALAVLSMFVLIATASAQHYNITSNWFVTNLVANLHNDNNNRGLAYSVQSNQVFVAYRGSPGSIAVLDGNTGASLGTLNGTIAAYNVGVADDGVIYGVPLANGVGAANLGIYAWTNSSATVRQCYTQTGSDATSLGQVQGQRVGDSFAIAGSGTSTVILLPINAGTSTKNTNNMLLFSTTDGQTFTPTVINITGMPTSFAGGGPEIGVAFYTNNTFLFRPGLGTSTYLVQYPANFASLSSPVTATVIATNTTLPNGGGSDVYLFSYSPAGNLLADYGQILNGAGSTALALFDISGFPNVGSLGTTSTAHANANGNFTGGVALGGQGKTNALYVLDSNNGVWGFGLTFVPAPVLPTITTQPSGGTVYTNLGSFTFTVAGAGTTPLYYYWQYNTVSNLATATTIAITTNTPSYTLSPLSTSQSGWYNVIVSNVAGTSNSVAVQLTVNTGLTTNPSVTQMWSLPADNSQPYLDTSYNTRGLAFDPNTTNVLVAEHASANIYALNALTGVQNFVLTTPQTGLPNGSIFPLGQIGVADDGVLYSCNVSSYNPTGFTAVSGQTDFTVIRFSSITDPNGPNPYSLYQSFTGDPGAFPAGVAGASSQDRWGDSMAIRGAGVNTQILFGTYETVGNHDFGTGYGTNVAILTTANGMDFTATTIAVTNAPDGFAYLGVAWGTNNTFWAKSPGFDLRQVSYNLSTGIGTVIQDFATTAGGGSLSGLCGVGLDNSNNILAGVNVSDTPNDLELFQIPSDGFPPQAYFQDFFATNNPNINGNAATTIKFPYIFSLDANNGIIGLKYSIPLVSFPITFAKKTGNNVALTWQTVAGHKYQVQFSNTLPGHHATGWTNVGPQQTATTNTMSYTDTSATTSTRYYQVVGQ